MSTKIQYPFIPEDRKIFYVSSGNQFMKLAKNYAKEFSLDKVMPGAAIIVKEGEVIGIDANGSDYHDKYGCRRIELGCKSGEGYELCEACHPKNHSESSAIKDAESRGNKTAGADLYLWGHWWCCKPCWEAMDQAGIMNVYLLENSEKLFNKNHPENIVGSQFG